MIAVHIGPESDVVHELLAGTFRTRCGLLAEGEGWWLVPPGIAPPPLGYLRRACETC